MSRSVATGKFMKQCFDTLFSKQNTGFDSIMSKVEEEN